MVDSNQSRRADFDFADNDPFAELTRIMGHDPRPAAAPATAGPDESVERALENELARDLDFGEFDEPSGEDRHAAPEQEPVAASADEAPTDEPVQAAAEEAQPSAAEPAWDAADPQSPSGPDLAAELALEDDFVEAFEQELQVRAETPPETVAADAEPLADEPSAPEQVPEPVIEAAAPEIRHAAADELLAPEPAVDASPVWPEAYEARGPQADVMPEPVAQAPQSSVLSDEISLEDELSALLAGSSPAPAAPEVDVFETAPAAEAAPVAFAASFAPEIQKAPAGEPWRPSLHTFGRANFPAPRRDSVAPAVPVAPVEAEPAATFVEPEPEAAPALPEPEALAPSGHDADAVTPAASHADEIEDLLGDFELNLDVEDVEPLPAAPEPEPIAAQAAPEEEQPAAFVTDDDTPAIETIEVAERAVALADDLDIPDIDYGAPAPRIYDELESEFDRAFGEQVPEEPAQQQQPDGRAPEPFDWGAMAPADPELPPADQPAMPADAWQPPLPDDAEYDYDSDLKHAIAMSAYEGEEPAEQAPRRRGLIVAAFVAAVAVVGGAGVFGMSILGGGSDSPALVMADSDPMKVRPENRGGATVPNQDSEVYQRVTDGAAASRPPSQERLITTAERPIDIAAEEDVAMLPPSISGEADGDVAAVGQSSAEETAALDDAGDAQQPKSDARIVQEPEASGDGLPGDMAVVTPRRVRTMVVRPDGTMVPREEPTPAPAAQSSDMVVAAVPALAPAASPGQAAPAAEDEGGPDPQTPDQVSVLPAPRVEPEIAPFDVIPPAEPAIAVERPEPTPALAPATAAAAAAGAWSMQIASQPSAEGAQSTYQDLARRYGNVLQGRGVNIVRANIAGKGVYYRVRIPAATRDEAIQLCTSYKAAGGSCFVSR